MWLQTPYGFFAILQDPTSSSRRFMVCARRKDHLERLLRSCSQNNGRYRLVDMPNRDYRWRIFCTPESLQKIMKVLTSAISTDDVKVSAQKSGADQRYLDALHSTWLTFSKIQESPPFGHFSGITDQQASFQYYKGPTAQCGSCQGLYPDDGLGCFCGAPRSSGSKTAIGV